MSALERMLWMKPCEGYEQELMGLLQEFAAASEKAVPYGLHYGEKDFPAILARERLMENGENLPDGFVPSTTYWLVRERDGRIVGAGNLRHMLNDDLTDFGGHIGYGVRPSERRKGYATRILAKMLHEASAHGISRALVTCNADNTSSERTILKNGGVYEDTRIEPSGNPVKRFWIDTTPYQSCPCGAH